jgi:hypothetical protein
MIASPDVCGRVDCNVRATDIQEIADRQHLFPAGTVRSGDPDNVAINVM